MVRQHHHGDEYESPESPWPKMLLTWGVAACVVVGVIWVLTRDDRSDPYLGDVRTTGTTVGTDRLTGLITTSSTPVGSPSTTATRSSPTTALSTTSGPAVPTSTAVESPTTSVSATTARDGTPTTQIAEPDYPTSSDGSPLPVIVTFDRDAITITGVVPSEAAKERLGSLAVANSKNDAPLHNNLVINPAVPIGVGVRVIELDSVRFPEGSAEILPEHATELARVAQVMTALPNTTVVVIGHADQRGDDVANFKLSEERAAAVVDFLTYLGVSPTRLSSRAVGESDLLTLADDETARALNRRTEFIFYGLLIE